MIGLTTKVITTPNANLIGVFGGVINDSPKFSLDTNGCVKRIEKTVDGNSGLAFRLTEGSITDAYYTLSVYAKYSFALNCIQFQYGNWSENNRHPQLIGRIEGTSDTYKRFVFTFKNAGGTAYHFLWLNLNNASNGDWIEFLIPPKLEAGKISTAF